MCGDGYNWGWWHFDAESGGSGAYLNGIIPPLVCTAGTDSGSSTYYCYNQAQWGYLPWANYQCLYVYVEASGNFYTSQYVFGETTSWFYECANPWNYWFIHAYTQPPAYDNENGYHYLTFNWADWDDCS